MTGEVHRWDTDMDVHKFLKLNDDKTEYIIIGTYKNLQYVADTDITIGDETIRASNFVRDLGFCLIRN